MKGAASVAARLLLGVMAACNRPGAPVVIDAGAASPPPTVPATPPSGPAPTASAWPRPAPIPCRAISVVGSAQARTRAPVGVEAGAGAMPGMVIKTGDRIDSWVMLDAAAKMTIKEPSSGRELLFTGESGALVLPCFHESEAWLARGEFVGGRGSGERPGADQWLVTPFAVVRYGSATVDVTVDATSAHVSLKGGSASAIASGGDAWQALDMAAPFVAKGTLDEGSNAEAANLCVKSETAAKALEDALLAPGETRDPGFGDLAKRATEARTLTRAACAISGLRAAR